MFPPRGNSTCPPSSTGTMKRPADGGRGLDGVVAKADGFFNPAMDLLDGAR